MSYSWEEIRNSIEEKERERVLSALSLLEQQEGFLEAQRPLSERAQATLEVFADAFVGISVGIIAVIINYFLLVWLLHLRF